MQTVDHHTSRGVRCYQYLCKRRDVQRGAITIEFIKMFLLLSMVFLLVLQIGLVYHARLIVNYATFEAARKGAVNHSQISVMRRELGIRLAPLYGGDADMTSALRSIGIASLSVQDPSATHLRIISPTLAAFVDWGVDDSATGRRVLPNSHLRHQSTDVGARSGVTLQDANLLKLEVIHGYDLRVPVAGALIVKTLRWLDPANALFYLRGKFPLRSVATVRMQSEAWQSEIISAASADSDNSHDTGSEEHAGLEPLSNPDPSTPVLETADSPIQSRPASPSTGVSTNTEETADASTTTQQSTGTVPGAFPEPVDLAGTADITQGPGEPVECGNRRPAETDAPVWFKTADYMAFLNRP